MGYDFTFRNLITLADKQLMEELKKSGSLVEGSGKQEFFLLFSGLQDKFQHNKTELDRLKYTLEKMGVYDDLVSEHISLIGGKNGIFH